MILGILTKLYISQFTENFIDVHIEVKSFVFQARKVGWFIILLIASTSPVDLD